MDIQENQEGGSENVIEIAPATNVEIETAAEKANEVLPELSNDGDNTKGVQESVDNKNIESGKYHYN